MHNISLNFKNIHAPFFPNFKKILNYHYEICNPCDISYDTRIITKFVQMI